MAMKVDKENENVQYNDEQHIYIDKNSGLKCISVTTLIEKFAQPFDEHFWSSVKALEELVGTTKFAETKKKLTATKKFDAKYVVKFGIEAEDFIKKKAEILQLWKNKNVEACERGTKIHKLHEDANMGGQCKELKRYGLGGKFKCITNNKLKVGDQGIYPELLLSRISEDGIFRLAGQADLVIIDGKDVYVLDYKTNRSINKSSYFDSNTKRKQMMQYPLNTIQDSNYWHYAIQLSTYAWMIQMVDPTLEIKGLMLIHYDHDNKETIYELDYLKDEVVRMLGYYKGTLVKEKANEKFKPIVY